MVGSAESSAAAAAKEAAPDAAAASPAREVAPATAPVSPSTRTTGQRSGRANTKKVPIPPPPRATPSSSSGYPGVSWNKRMGAWLSFYYDSNTRRSRTFHPKYYDFDVEKAKQAAIEFMKSIEKHPRCSLRKSRRDNKAATTFISSGYDLEQQFIEVQGRTRKRGAANHMLSMDFKARNAKSPISCPTTQTSLSDMYDIESLKRNFIINSNVMDPCYMSNAGSMESDYLAATGSLLENNYLSGSFESQQDYDKGYQSPMAWPGCQSFFGAQDYYVDTHKYGMPFLEGDLAYPSPSPSMYHENDIMYNCNGVQHHQPPPAQQHPHHVYPENQDANGHAIYAGTQYDASPANEDAEIHMLMQSIALSPSESFEGFRLNAYNYGDATANYAGLTQPYANTCATPLGSPYLSPYVHSMYSQVADETDINRTFGFQNLILANEAQQNQQTQPIMHSQS